MKNASNRCVLWVGDKHSGKTTAAASMVEIIQRKGYIVGGILAPSIYEKGLLIGFDILDIKTRFQVPLAERDKTQAGSNPFRFFQEGVQVGRSALDAAGNISSHLVVVDEYGPLELNGGGWRRDVDSLIMESSLRVVLVVRRQIADRVKKLYEGYGSFSLEALEPGAVDRILDWLKETR